MALMDSGTPIKNETEFQSLSRKLDRIGMLLEGTGDDNPGLLHMVRRHEISLYGNGSNESGVVMQVMWLRRIRTWALTTLSAAIGSLLTILGSHFVKL